MTDYRSEVPDGTAHFRAQHVVDGEKLGFEWHGGAYIQVCRGEAFGTPREVINVWNYRTDQPTIPRTREAFTRRVREWIGEYGEEALAHDVRNNW